MIYGNCKIYGPYTRKDRRQHVVVVYPDGRRKTVSYPKLLMEKHLDRYLNENETVDHIDCNFHNNSINNLRVIERTQHCKEDAIRKKPMVFSCPSCNKDFELSGKKLSDAIQNRKRGSVGPFCSKSCAGKYGKIVQNGGKKLEVHRITPEYITLKQSLYGETYKVDAAKTGKP